MLLASVCSSRTSDALKASSRSRLPSSISPRAWSPASSGTKTADFSICVPGTVLLPYLSHLLRHVPVDDDGFARTQDVGGEACLAERVGLQEEAAPLLVGVRIVDQVRLRIVDADSDVGLVEDLADLVADGVVDPLHVELGGERLLDAVDDRELRGALFALLEQALRLVEQARVLERDAHAVGERLQQAHVRVAVTRARAPCR